MMKKIFAVPILLISCLCLFGCADPYGASAKASADVATGIGQVMTFAQSSYSQGVITRAEYSNVLGYAEYANKANESFQSCISSANAAPTDSTSAFTACTNTLVTTLDNPTQLALLNVANTSAHTAIEALVSSGVATLNSLVIALKGA